MHRIITADDHTMFREGLTQMLTQAGLDVVAECSNGSDVFETVLKLKPDVVLLDISMPGTDGIAVTRQLVKEQALDCKVIILSMYGSAEMYQQALDAGASGYLLKDCAFAEVVAAIENVLAGRKYCSESLQSQVTPCVTPKPLTKREREIVRHLAKGLSVKEISDTLFISPKTVDVHRTNIMKKLNLHSTAALISYAHKSGLI